MEMHYTHISPGAYYEVNKTLKSGNLSEGVRVKEFEQKLTNFGLVNPVAVNSGTSALHLALVCSGVVPGDEVILPAQTFIATGMAVLMCGATPVFADVDPFTGNICPKSVKEKITDKTKAILCVHWTGLPCDLTELHVAKEDRDIIVIEDAAQAFGAYYQNKAIGSFSRFTCFSFQATKHLTTGDGGALCSSMQQDSLDAFRFRWFGIDRTQVAGELGERENTVRRLGFKYHMNDVAASIGVGNLEELPNRLRRRRNIGIRLRSEFYTIDGIKPQRTSTDRTHAYYVFPLLVERRLDFVRALKGRGIPTSVLSRRIDRHPALGGIKECLPGQEYYDEHQINLPCHSNLREQEVDAIVRAVREGW